MQIKENNKTRILQVKFVIEEFLNEKGNFSIDDLYYFLYGIGIYKKFYKDELEKIVNFLIRGKDIRVRQQESLYFAL